MKKYVNKPDKPMPAYSTFPLNLVFAVKLTESGSRQSSGVQEFRSRAAMETSSGSKGKIEAFTVK